MASWETVVAKGVVSARSRAAEIPPYFPEHRLNAATSEFSRKAVK
jgi:hypothetical protein